MDPIEAINNEEITISLNGDETLALTQMLALLLMSDGLIPVESLPPFRSIFNKLGPGIKEKAMKQTRIQRDGLN